MGSTRLAAPPQAAYAASTRSVTVAARNAAATLVAGLAAAALGLALTVTLTQ